MLVVRVRPVSCVASCTAAQHAWIAGGQFAAASMHPLAVAAGLRSRSQLASVVAVDGEISGTQHRRRGQRSAGRIMKASGEVRLRDVTTSQVAAVQPALGQQAPPGPPSDALTPPRSLQLPPAARGTRSSSAASTGMGRAASRRETAWKAERRSSSPAARPGGRIIGGHGGVAFFLALER